MTNRVIGWGSLSLVARGSLALVALTGGLLTLAGCASGGTARLSVADYQDKCKGAWVGQMIGVCYGEPYQFRSNGKPITAPMRDWSPELIAGSIRQDDVYVELTFLAALEKYGLGVTMAEAGQAFAATDYPLWHANYYGRANIRHGIMPPQSGHPDYNRHADDIDFQIEADLLGIICPALPGESNRLCDVFGHVMNYGDGVYGGMFMAGMYTAAYFEPTDVRAVIEAGLRCIPAESQYAKCIRDTLRWCEAEPDDWLATWHRVEQRWNDDLDCIPGNPHNIDAKLNGAYTVMGLMYGRGDFLKTVEICTRCGQDADSSTANAGGVLGCMIGYAAMGDELTGGVEAVADETFLGTDYSLNTLVPACQRMTETIIARHGGVVTAAYYEIPRQAPTPPSTLEQWEHEHRELMQPVTAHEVALWSNGWTVEEIPSAFDGGYYPAEYGRTNVLAIIPLQPDRSVVLTKTMTVPKGQDLALHLEVGTEGQHGDFLLKVFIDGKLLDERIVANPGSLQSLVLPLHAPEGNEAEVRLEFHANDYSIEAAYLREVAIR